MAKNFTRSILLAAMAAGACFGTAAVSAQTCINGMHGSTTLGPDSSCLTSAESEIFLESTKDSTTVMGNIGSQTGLPVVQFTSTVGLNSGNGMSTIKPAAGASFPNLDFTVPGHKFFDFLFDLQMVKTSPENLTVTALSGSTVERTFTYTGLPHDADLRFTVSDPGNLTAIDLSSTTGIKQAKMFDVSGVSGGSVPEPSTWALMALGLVGLGLAAARRTGRSRLGGAMA